MLFKCCQNVAASSRFALCLSAACLLILGCTAFCTEPPTSVLPPQSQAKASDKNLGHAPEPAQASNADAMQANDLQPGSEERLGRSKHKRRHRHHRSRSSPDPQAPLADGVPDSSGQLAENRGQAVDVAGGTSIELGNEERHKRHRGFSESDGSDMDMSPR